MRALLLLSPLLLSLGCVDDPCAGQGPDRLQVWPQDQAAWVSSADPRAFQSIAEAIAAAEEGAAICIAPGLYTETLRVDRPGLRLLGAGPGQTVVQAPTMAEDPRESVDTTLALASWDLVVQGLTLRGGARGLVVERDAEVRATDLILEQNGTGLLALGPAALGLEDVVIRQNPAIGAWIGAGEGQVVIRGGELSGNGTLGSSEVGGLYSEVPVIAHDLSLRDNAGSHAADLLLTRGLWADGLTGEHPGTTIEAPRVMTTGATWVSNSGFVTAGGPALHARCAGEVLGLDNLTVLDTAGQSEALSLRDCQGRLAHATLVGLGEADAQAAVRLAGEGRVEVLNTAAVGHGALLDDGAYAGVATAHHNFLGTPAEAALLRPLAVAPDLRPQSDSPLVDAGVDAGVAQDPDGRPRPGGAAPDIGAYEKY